MPLNSPDPFRSIELLAKSLPASALVGAGTVLTAGAGRPPARGRRTGCWSAPTSTARSWSAPAHHGMVTMPGVFTPTEAFLGAVARRLGAEILSGQRARPEGHRGDQGRAAQRRPSSARSAACRTRISPTTRKIGVSTFGLGSSLYTPGLEPPRRWRAAPWRRSPPGTPSSHGPGMNVMTAVSDPLRHRLPSRRRPDLRSGDRTRCSGSTSSSKKLLEKHMPDGAVDRARPARDGERARPSSTPSGSCLSPRPACMSATSGPAR